MLRIILFDLDGTLVDTAPELADALNDTLSRLALPLAPEDRVRSWIGDGARVLLGRALADAGVPAAALDSTLASAWPGFALDYNQRCGTRSRVHDGALALLKRVRAEGLQTVVLTNKESGFAHRVLAAHDLAAEFDLIVAGDTLPIKKPHPGVVTHVLAALHAQVHEALLVDDAATDVRTARAAGIPVWLVRHGYPQSPLTGADAPDGFIEHFDQFNPQAACDRITVA